MIREKGAIPMMYKATVLAALLAGACATPASADVVISTDATQNMSCSGGVCAPTASDAVLNVTDLENLLASGNVSVVTTNGSVQANNIAINAAFSWSAANALTLDAYQSITFTAPVTDRGAGSVSLVTNDGGSNGLLSFLGGNSLTVANLKNSLSINGVRHKLVSSIKTLAYVIAKHPKGAFALANDYDAKKDGLYRLLPIPLAFTGSFNGLGHSISNLAIADSTDSTLGFFYELTAPGTISSIGLENVVVRASIFFSVTGALVGVQNGGTVFNSWSTGKVNGGYGSDTGGLVGHLTSNGAVTNAWSSAKVTNLNGGGAGGLVGAMDSGAISSSFATGFVHEYLCVGGLVGSQYAGSIANSYATGKVRSTDSRYADTGGFVGCTNGGNLASSYSTGSVRKAVGLNVGGFIGFSSGGSFSKCYWDTRTSGTDVGIGSGDKRGVKGISTKKLQSTLPEGFDPAIWAEDAAINNGFPYLIANPPAK
jgi:hypothetical protein